MNEKPWWLSRTLWLNVLTLIVLVLTALLGTDLVKSHPDAVLVIAAAVAVGNVVLRFVTTTAITPLVLMLLALSCSAAWADGPACPIRVTLEELHDADSPKVTVHLPFGVDLPSRTIRATGYDAWEVTRTRRTVTITAAELTKGKRARDEFAALIASGSLWLDPAEQQTDPYGRLNAALWVRAGERWIEVAAWMRERGHVRSGE